MYICMDICMCAAAVDIAMTRVDEFCGFLCTVKANLQLICRH